ncbi:hypothetical protein Y032_0021g358 [Ancylostoma ceylanicum]|uniref:Uncharacterized protein n=1 Tax=Ancylostoma ceylanicum TaxID=53326 RepID=A0A016V0Y8_9BILA|nr:hypothetical protein Y032_0021g358 [Ancylostoma ceylanicum]
MGAIRTRLEKEAEDVGNKFAVFGHSAGTFLKNLAEEVAVLKMKVISDVLFLAADANFKIQLVTVEQASENLWDLYLQSFSKR